jgi:mRNA-degrading endonuclease RelE of RelBE toxin-antitoxin system
MYDIEIRDHLDRTFRKLAKKDAKQMEAIAKKIEEMARDPHAHKLLSFPLAGKRRVHVGSHVLLFSADEARKTVVLEDYEHHDRVYRVI